MRAARTAGLIVLLFAVIGLWIAPSIRRWLYIDACFDLGGVWNYEQHTCQGSRTPVVLIENTRAWTGTFFFSGLALLIAVLLFVEWFGDWWLTNLLRNQLEAKRALKRQGREPDVKP